MPTKCGSVPFNPGRPQDWNPKHMCLTTKQLSWFNNLLTIEDPKILTNLSHAKRICLAKPESADWTASTDFLHLLPDTSCPQMGLGSRRVGTGWPISTAALAGERWSLVSGCMEAFKGAQSRINVSPLIHLRTNRRLACREG